jgi:hypothetical protein
VAGFFFARNVRRWTNGRTSTFGVLGCFFFFLALLLLAVWIALEIMESMSPV